MPTLKSKPFFKKVRGSYFEDENSESSSEDNYGKGSADLSHGSMNSFEKELYKNLENPSSVTDSLNENFQHAHSHGEDENEIVVKNDDLKNFF